MITKKECLATLFKAATLYKQNFLGNKYLVLYIDENRKPDYIEIVFYKASLLNLTGLLFTKKGGNSNQFFDLCLKKRLKESDFEFDDSGFAELKLNVIEYLFAEDMSARTIGDYNYSQPVLQTDKLVGGVYACLGVLRSSKGYFFPNTTRSGDIGDLVTKKRPIVAIFKKQHTQPLYDAMVHKTRNEKYRSFVIPNRIKKLLSEDVIKAFTDNKVDDE